jgi:hypothetical protein
MFSKLLPLLMRPGQQISRIVDIRGWRARNDEARAVDQQALNERLLRLETNHQRLKDTLSKFCIRVTRESSWPCLHRYGKKQCPGDDSSTAATTW